MHSLRPTVRQHLAPVIGLTLIGFAASSAQAITLIASGTLSATTDLSGLNYNLESGVAANTLGGIGSALAYAGGDTFLALPDRGPNATAYTNGSVVDNTTSYIARFQTVSMNLQASVSGSLPYTLTPTLSATTLLYSTTALNYGSGNFAGGVSIGNGAPALNTAEKFYFTGRSDGFAGSSSMAGSNARLDPEGIRVSSDGLSVFITDEYGPYVYQFNRATGERTRTYELPAAFGVTNLSPVGATEIANNATGRVSNKGMEGLAISPDGTTLIGFMQSPLAQDGGDGGRYNRLVTINVETGATQQFIYDNYLTATAKAYNSSEIVAINDHEFLILERDGKGLGDGSNAVIKKVFKIDIAGAQDASNVSGAANLAAYAVTKTEFLDLKTALNALGLSNAQIPAKLEGMAFGQDVVIGGVTKHTLYINNDNDFVADIAGPSNFYVFAFDATDLPTYQAQSVAPVPLPAAAWLLLSGMGALGAAVRRRRQTA